MGTIEDIARIPGEDVWALAHYLIYRITTAELPQDENGLHKDEAADQVTVLTASIVNAWNQTHEKQMDMPWLWDMVREMRTCDNRDCETMRMVQP